MYKSLIMTQSFYNKVATVYNMLKMSNQQMRVLRFLEYHPERQFSVTELYIKFRLPYSQTNNDLLALLRKGFLNREIHGKNAFYSINLERILKLNESLKVIK